MHQQYPNAFYYEILQKYETTRKRADGQHDSRPVKYSCRPLPKFRDSVPYTTPQSLAAFSRP